MLVFFGVFGAIVLAVAMSFFSTIPGWISTLGNTEAPYAACGDYGECDQVKVDISDTASLQRGAATFVHYCLGCHSAKYQRYEAVAEDLNIPHDLFAELLLPSGSKLSDHIISSLSDKDAAAWFGMQIPDLTHQVRAKGPDYLYTYLRTFYPDASRETGSNNMVKPNVAMPNIMLLLQGEQVCDTWGCRPKPEGVAGQLSPAEFDRKVADLVNFMTYLSEPIALKRQKIGGFVLLYVLALTILLALTYREYKKDID